MVVVNPEIGALGVILRLLDNNHGHLTRKACEQVLRPLPDETPAQM
jgi:hypothetical protein